MKTFSQSLKDKMVAETIKHREADQIVQGTYGQTEDGKWRGCAVGCAIHSLNKIKKKDLKTSDHTLYETYLGIPKAIARLEDTIFEGLPVEVAKLWPERFIKAVPVDTDLSLVIPKFYLKILLDKKHGIRQYAFYYGKKAIDKVAEVHKNHIKTGKLDESAWSAVSARSANWYAESARSTDGYAAWSARSAWSAAWSANWYAESAHYEWMADVLIEILEVSNKE